MTIYGVNENVYYYNYFTNVKLILGHPSATLYYSGI